MQSKFLEYRKNYPTFIYHSFDIVDLGKSIRLSFDYEIPGITSFRPWIEINKDDRDVDVNDSFFRYLVFHIGLIELVSYFKCTCSPNVIIEAGYLSEEQISWFKKLYYYGLGEFLYLNHIDISEDDLMNIQCASFPQTISIPHYQGVGNLIPIGGGKDSLVSLELLKDYYKDNHCFIINPKPVTTSCAEAGGYQSDRIIGVKRIIDKNLIDLNQRGFLNGHTPFSAVVAFLSYLTAYIYGKKYIVLSNEASANEATVLDTKINHQYSKTYEFENDFNCYTQKFFGIDIHYFSLLRPLSEFQIALLFSHYPKYHFIFRSCNVGSKNEKWEWCCHCPKCLFVYIILSPFLYPDKLVSIFGEDLYSNKELLPIFLELLGYSETKPFECVGTYGEARYAVSLTIQKLGDQLPYLLFYYKEHYPLELSTHFEREFNTEHNLPKEFEEILRKELSHYVS